MRIIDFPRHDMSAVRLDEAKSNVRIAKASLDRLHMHIESLCKITSASEANEIRDAYATARGAVAMILHGLEGAMK